MTAVLEEIAQQIRQGGCEEAAKRLEQVGDGVEDRTEVIYLRGLLHERQYDYPAALAAYEEVIELDPKGGKALFRAALMSDLLGNDGDALELYRRCAAGERVSINVLMNLAVLLEEEGQYDEAENWIDQVIEAFPAHHRARAIKQSIEASQVMVFDEHGRREREMRSAILDVPVSEFELSVRSRNCLKQMDIGTLGDLLNTTEEDLLAYKNFGETSLNEIKIMLAQKGLRIGQALDQPPPDEEGAESAGPVPLTQDVSLLHRTVSELELSVRSRKCLQRLGITTIGELTTRSEAELMATKNFGMTSLTEIKERLEKCGLSLR